MAMSVDAIPNRNSPPAVRLGEAWREGSWIRRKTLANLSRAPLELVSGIRVMLKGGVVVGVAGIDQALTIRRSLPHRHVAKALRGWTPTYFGSSFSGQGLESLKSQYLAPCA